MLQVNSSDWRHSREARQCEQCCWLSSCYGKLKNVVHTGGYLRRMLNSGTVPEAPDALPAYHRWLPQAYRECFGNGSDHVPPGTVWLSTVRDEKKRACLHCSHSCHTPSIEGMPPWWCQDFYLLRGPRKATHSICLAGPVASLFRDARRRRSFSA